MALELTSPFGSSCPQKTCAGTHSLFSTMLRQSVSQRHPVAVGRLRACFSTTVVQEPSEEASPHPKYPRLFAPLRLNNGIVLPNRALMGSMHTGLEPHSMPKLMESFFAGSTPHTDPKIRMAQYFRERAQGGVGLMVTGGIAPNMAGWTGPFSSQLTTDSEMEEHKIVTEAVHDVQIPSTLR